MPLKLTQSGSPETTGIPKSRSSQETILVYCALIFALLAAFFLYQVGRYALAGFHPFQFFADSNTYHDSYSGLIAGPEGFIDVSYNYLGPLIILSVLGGNIYLVMAFNVAVFTVSIVAICRTLGIEPLRAAAFQFVSPLTISSLLSVNKEIITFPTLALLFAAYQRRSFYLAGLAVIVSMFSRWQLTVFCIVLVGLYFVRKLNRYVLLAALAFAVSTAYYFSQDLLDPVFRSNEIQTSTLTEGSGIFERLLDVQQDGFYFIALPFKAAHLMFSSGVRIGSILDPILVYNDQIVSTFCLVNILFFLVLIYRRALSMNNDLMAISVVFFIVFALTPIFAPRYFYTVFVLWGLVLAGARGSIPAGSTART